MRLAPAVSTKPMFEPVRVSLGDCWQIRVRVE